MVRLDGVAKRFGAVAAVDDASFAVERGQFLTILGPSGSGKTTVLRLIAGFLEPSAGHIHVHGQPVERVPAYARAIGMVFQRLALFPHLSVFDNVAYPLRRRGFAKGGIGDRVERYLDLVQLRGFGSRRIHELSGGQQQRVAIARALVFEPDLLLLDEPLAALDRKLREDMQLEFRRIQQELGVTTINVTHDQREALVMSDRVLVMDGGRIQQDARPEEAYRRPANRFVAGFIGVTNFLPGTVVDAAVGSVRVGHEQLTGRPGTALATGQPVEVALRAERLQVGPAGTDVAGVAATVDQVVFEGDRLVYELSAPSLGDARLVAFDTDPRGHGALEPGDDVRVFWRPEDVMIFPRAS
jgi:putative spermidine/putrescine transport system ATP-binding protein